MKPYIIISALTGILAASCASETKKETTEPAAYCISPEFKSKVEIEEVKSLPIMEGLHLMGSVETNPDNVVEYVSLVKGIVSNVFFSLGDNVKKGQVLAEIRSSELSALQAQSTSIDAEIASAKRNLEAVTSMHNDKLAADKDLVEARSQLQSLQSEKNRLSSDLNLYSANVSKGVFQIKAPSSGVITVKNINAGSQISDESGILFTIASLNNVWVMANVYASNLQTVQPGMKVEISTLSYPGELFYGNITTMSPTMDENEKVIKARIQLDNSNFKLKPGMLVDVMALSQSSKVANAIPINAILFADNENYVIVYQSDCQLSIRKINIIARNDKYYYIDESLKAGEKIIAKNQLLIFEQLKNVSNQ